MSLHLHGVGHFHPETEITNQFLEDLDIGTSNAWIMERVGIRTRRTGLPLDYIRETRNSDPRMAAEATLYGNAETGRRAAEMAIARAGIEGDEPVAAHIERAVGLPVNRNLVSSREGYQGI